jgi:opacity protein-like surface antigen
LTLVFLLALSGCGYALLQTARPVAEGELEVVVGAGVVYNDMVADRGLYPDNVPPQLALRYGVREDLDVGVALFMGGGGLVDGKLNLLPPAGRLALSVQAGFGAATNLGAATMPNTPTVLHLPLRLLGSWDLPWVTPYAGAGYGFFWVFGYGNPEAGVQYADRAGHGDGLLMLTGGVEFFPRAAVQLLLEYGYWTQIVDDPGDFHSFADNHLISAGLRF